MSTGLVRIFVAAWLIVSISSPALAYLDPVTGSFLIQGVIAGVVAVLAAIRSIRERVLTLLGFRKPELPAAKTESQVGVSTKPAPRDAN